MTGMSGIEGLARDYGAARARLAAVVTELDDEVRALRRRRIARLKAAVALAAQRKDALAAAIDANRGLFARPRTRLLHGIRVGLAKGKGIIGFADAGVVVRLIRRHLPERADALIKVSETPLRNALAQLTAAELKRIGVSVEETGDRVVVKVADGEIDKLVDALLAAAGDDAETEPETKAETGGKPS